MSELNPLQRRLLRAHIDDTSLEPRIERRFIWPWVALAFAIGLSLGAVL